MNNLTEDEFTPLGLQKCPFCPQRFLTMQDWWNHILKKHPNKE